MLEGEVNMLFLPFGAIDSLKVLGSHPKAIPYEPTHIPQADPLKVLVCLFFPRDARYLG